MIDLEKNKKKLEEAKQKYLYPDDYEQKVKDFEELVSRKENEPEYEKLISQYRDIEGKIKHYFLKSNNRKQTNCEIYENSKLDQIFQDIGTLDEQSRQVQSDILKLYFREIMQEES